MCNCGNKRDELATQSPARHSNAEPLNEPERKTRTDTNFVYTGNSALSVTGSVSGKRYRFNFMGDTQMIDYRDVEGMYAVPVLKKIK
jgi:hypothetical protein